MRVQPDEPVHVHSPAGVGIPGVHPIPECPAPQENATPFSGPAASCAPPDQGRAAPMMPIRILGVSIVLLESRRAYVWHVLVWGGLGALVFVRSSPRAY